MALHAPSGRTRLGIALAATTMIAWATLPVVLSVLLEVLEAKTLTWFRFALSAIVLAMFLWKRNGLPQLRELSGFETVWCRRPGYLPSLERKRRIKRYRLIVPIGPERTR